MNKKKKKKVEANEVKPVVVNRTPGFSSKFKEDLTWWFKQDFEKASKILDLVTDGDRIRIAFGPSCNQMVYRLLLL